MLPFTSFRSTITYEVIISRKQPLAYEPLAASLNLKYRNTYRPPRHRVFSPSRMVYSLPNQNHPNTLPAPLPFPLRFLRRPHPTMTARLSSLCVRPEERHLLQHRRRNVKETLHPPSSARVPALLSRWGKTLAKWFMPFPAFQLALSLWAMHLLGP